MFVLLTWMCSFCFIYGLSLACFHRTRKILKQLHLNAHSMLFFIDLYSSGFFSSPVQVYLAHVAMYERVGFIPLIIVETICYLIFVKPGILSQSCFMINNWSNIQIKNNVRIKMSKYVNKAWLRLSSAKSKWAIYKYRYQVIRLSHIDVFNDTQKGVNLFFFYKQCHLYKKIYSIA